LKAVASIDIGTNTLRLLIAERDDDGALSPIICERVVARLGGGYTEACGIDPEAAERALVALEGFREIIDKYDAHLERAVATSVVRRAVNKEWFVAQVKKRAAINIEVIDGEEEAGLSVAGVLSVVRTGKATKLIVDIGGGSTEFIVVRDGEILFSESLELGVVHLSEEYQSSKTSHSRSDPPSKSEITGMENVIRVAVEGLKKNIKDRGFDVFEGSVFDDVEFVGTAGTFTTIAAIDLALETYDSELVNNYVVDRIKLTSIYSRLVGLSLNDRKGILSLEKGREDLIIPGILIVLSIMYVFGFLKVKVSDGGLLEGLLLKTIECEEKSEEVS
jgi:exopolyphosphatase/guanosine-5'-triphosphate,3'-diphosphate pyrophosphatase